MIVLCIIFLIFKMIFFIFKYFFYEIYLKLIICWNLLDNFMLDFLLLDDFLNYNKIRNVC